MLDLSRLTAEQRQAVVAGDGPLLILAGPGSGKTTVLAARIAYLVTGRPIAPSSILGITFTTRAARELRTRLTDLLGQAGREVEVTTFHAFGLRIVRAWSEELGFAPGPLAVYGAEDARAALRTLAAGLDLVTDPWSLADLARRLDQFRLSGELAPGAVQGLPELAAAYEALLRRRNAVDYAAMLALPLRLFAQRPDVLRMCQDAYRHVLSDEFQDVCALQYALLSVLAERHRNLVVVGDPCQNLFGWRGADVRFLLDFRQDFPEAGVIGLTCNFRSTRRVVDVANALSAGLPYRRLLWTSNPPGDPAALHIAPDDEAEAAFIAAEIERLYATEAIAHYSEVAILYRTNQQVPVLALALRERHIPYRVRGRSDFFGRKEVCDAIAYLRLAHNPDDGPALARIVNTPPRRLARLADDLHRQPAKAEDLVARATPYGAAAAESAGALLKLLQDLHTLSAAVSAAEVLEEAMQRSGYREWVATLPDGGRRLENLGLFGTLAARSGSDLAAWLADLQLDEDDVPAGDDVHQVVLSTIHGAKGAEWRVVFVAGVEEGLLPHWRSLLARPVESGIEDELRVAYVAMTRPRERLYLTLSLTRRTGQRTEPRQPSRFLRGLPVGRAERAA